jgi:tRNA (mo5U34)-methyltransferase
MAYSKEQVEEMVQSVLYWWHSINLGNGVTTKGHKTPERLAEEVEALHLPDLRGKTVLDIGAWDGFFSFEAERRGAARVVALDCDSWLCEATYNPEYEKKCRELGITPDPHSHPDNLVWRAIPEPKGKRGFDLAHRLLDSKVESVVGSFLDVDLSDIGTFDVVLFLGVLYHMENMLAALKRLAALTKELAIIETHAVVVPGYEHYALCEFYESEELNSDPTNWWGPNEKALAGLCRAAGFRHAEIVQGPPETGAEALEVLHYRAVAHAWK